MYGNKTMELSENQKADVVFWHSVSPVSISTVRTEGPRPHHNKYQYHITYVSTFTTEGESVCVRESACVLACIRYIYISTFTPFLGF